MSKRNRIVRYVCGQKTLHFLILLAFLLKSHEGDNFYSVLYWESMPQLDATYSSSAKIYLRLNSCYSILFQMAPGRSKQVPSASKLASQSQVLIGSWVNRLLSWPQNRPLASISVSFSRKKIRPAIYRPQASWIGFGLLTGLQMHSPIEWHYINQ